MITITISGKQGIGKTTLANILGRELSQHGYCVEAQEGFWFIKDECTGELPRVRIEETSAEAER